MPIAPPTTPNIKVANPYGRSCLSGLSPKAMKAKFEYTNMMPPQSARLPESPYRNMAATIVTNPLMLVKNHGNPGSLITEIRMFPIPPTSDNTVAAETIFPLFIHESPFLVSQVSLTEIYNFFVCLFHHFLGKNVISKKKHKLPYL